MLLDAARRMIERGEMPPGPERDDENMFWHMLGKWLDECGRDLKDSGLVLTQCDEPSAVAWAENIASHYLGWQGLPTADTFREYCSICENYPCLGNHPPVAIL
jgi:hypothetical protein